MGNEFLCFRCAEDKFLSSWIKKHPESANEECSFCSMEEQCITLEQLTDKVEEIFDQYFEPGEEELYWGNDGGWSDWRTRGESMAETFSYIIDRGGKHGEDIFNAVCSIYHDRHCNPYDGEYLDMDDENRGFEERFLTSIHVEKWIDFKQHIKHSQRFFADFNGFIALDEIENLLSFKTYSGEPLVKTIEPNSAPKIYRARGYSSRKEYKAIQKQPFHELSAPPAKNATAGRLNPAGIPVFYASLNNPKTCLKELRLSVGDTAFVGEFELFSGIKVLDLTVSEQVSVETNFFDPNYDRLIGIKQFLTSLNQEISRPIRRQDELLDYIPTQVLAEYLKEKHQIDGILFYSAQGSDVSQNDDLLSGHLNKPTEKERGINLVLFRKGAELPCGPKVRMTAFYEQSGPPDEPESPQYRIEYDKEHILDNENVKGLFAGQSPKIGWGEGDMHPKLAEQLQKKAPSLGLNPILRLKTSSLSTYKIRNIMIEADKDGFWFPEH